MISDTLLDYLRDIQDGYLPDRCDVSRYVESYTADGPVQEWQTTLTDIPCRISSRTTTAAEGVGGAAQQRAVSDWLLWLPAETDVTVRDRLVVGARTFEVERVVGESYETARACACSEVT